ncbi:MAG: serine protein kinase RIO [Candidatus Aenigmarchaeota archaeon]|nr:serine protein kinase RIO [Candidatus Aenigmarchaeota archaeon]
MGKTRKRESIKDSESFKIERGIFDERTLLNIYRLMNKGFIDTVESVVKEGKESVVLAGLDKQGRWVAIKVYRTLACDYKSMWKYLVGDPRIKGLKKDRWKVVSLWCKKEFKNLLRAKEGGVDCPQPIAFYQNVLVMEFIGKKGVPAPRLVDVELGNPERVYKKVVKNLEKIIKAGLVHGDFSAYNILFYKKPWIIDFSHAMPIKHHILALDFLKKDIRNISKFFSKLGVEVEDVEEVYRRLLQVVKGG